MKYFMDVSVDELYDISGGYGMAEMADALDQISATADQFSSIWNSYEDYKNWAIDQQNSGSTPRMYDPAKHINDPFLIKSGKC